MIEEEQAVDETALGGPIETVFELGEIIRSARKQRKLTLKKVSGLSRLSMRFLSELERGKETAELGKALQTIQNLGLELIIQPRGYHKIQARRLRQLKMQIKQYTDEARDDR